MTRRNNWTAHFDRLEIKPAGARKVHPLGIPDTSPLPSLRGPRSPKGKRGGMTAEQDATRRLERQRAKRRAMPFVSEVLVLRACMDVLEAHPFVALWWRQNTGSMKIAGRFVKFSFKGASDLMGQAIDGKFIAVETKATGKKADDDQAAFLLNVATHNGYSICVDDAGKLLEWLDSLNRPANSPQNVREGTQEGRGAIPYGPATKDVLLAK